MKFPHLFGSVFFRLSLAGAAMVLAGAAARAEAPAAANDFDKTVQPFLDQHCMRCHNEKKTKGELRLDLLTRDFASPGAARWGDIMDRINTGEMPPKKEPKPSPAEAARIVEILTGKMKEGEATRLAKRDRVEFHKLTREEYANTVYDLLGVHFDVNDPTGLPEDPNWRGFERIGSVLSISPAHVEKYFAAGESILAEALPAAEPKWNDQFFPAWKLRGFSGKNEIQAAGLLDKVRVDVWPGSTLGGQPGSVYGINIPTTGDYRFRIKLSGLKPTHGRAPHLVFYSADCDRMLFEQDVVAEEDAPVTLEWISHLPAGSHPMRIVNDVPGPSNLPRAGRNGPHAFFSIKQGREPWQTKLTDEDGKAILPFLIIDWIDVQGPVTAYPTMGQKQYLPTASADLSAAREALTRFAERAFRRSPTKAEVDRYTHLVETEMQSGEKFESAYKTAMLAILCSKDFFYIVEGTPEKNREKITDWELASRLSYFLWSTMPDEALMADARAGKLHEPETLRKQIRRMLADARIERFTESFTKQWLQLRRVGMFPPDKKIYPTYDDYLQKSIIGETTSYFAEVLKQDLTLREFLDSNWTMVNARLALHYDMPGINDDVFQRVALKPEDHRGGLLTMASVLSLTSDGTRHRPVHRGKWILESIIGKPPPAPPANVKPIDPTPATQKKATLRQKLDAHKSNPTCAACHAKIDPLGLAFDNYDAIGRWRTVEVVQDGAGDNPPVDASGELPDGRKYAGASDFKKLMMDDLDKFSYAFIDKLATYALRRSTNIDDRAALTELAKQSKSADYRLREIVEQFVLSDLFQKR